MRFSPGLKLFNFLNGTSTISRGDINKDIYLYANVNYSTKFVYLSKTW